MSKYIFDFFFIVLLLFMCSLSETCDWVFNLADSFSLRQWRFGNLGVTPHWLDYVHGIHTLVFLLDNHLWCLIMFLWTLNIRSGDSTARIWAIGDVACSSSMENGTSGVLVLKHFKGRANEKSKDVTTLDWNVSSYFHYFYAFSKSVNAAFFPVLLSQFSLILHQRGLNFESWIFSNNCIICRVTAHCLPQVLMMARQGYGVEMVRYYA